MTTYDITFGNGLVLKGCELIGGGYWSPEKVKASDLEGGLERVIIEPSDQWGVPGDWYGCEVMGISEERGGSAIMMRELTYEEVKERKRWREKE